MPNLNTNERWWVEKIQAMIKETRYGKVELCLTLTNGNVATVKEKSEKSYSFANKN